MESFTCSVIPLTLFTVITVSIDTYEKSIATLNSIPFKKQSFADVGLCRVFLYYLNRVLEVKEI